MILEFPDHATLKLALTSGGVPGEVHATSAVVGENPEGAVFVETEESLSKDVRRELKRLGVKGKRWWPKTVERREVASWLWAFPLRRSGLPPFDDQTPVLFELSDREQLAEVVNEILRLGNDRQAFRYLEGAADEETVLLRVVGPLYYSLLRAFEGNGRATLPPNGDAGGEGEAASVGPAAYVERSPRVWIEAGWDHPFAERLAPPPGSVWLLQPRFDWRSLDEAPFRDVYEVLEFDLPVMGANLVERELDERLNVPLRLSRGGPTDGGELWVLDERGIAQLDDFVQYSRDTLLERLAFAVGDVEGERFVVLRARPGKGAPPVVVLDGLACRPYLKLPNLFLPTGSRLHPPVRRDTVKQLLAADDGRVTWLRPDGGEDGRPGLFTPFDIAETAFRPLTDWVDYVLDREHEPLDAWVRSTMFDFERFVCPEEQAERRKREREKPVQTDKKKRDRKPDSRKGAKPKPGVARAKLRPVLAPIAAAEKPAERRRIEERLRELEKSFIASDLPAESPERGESWQEMAQLNGALGHYADAAICWTQTFWEGETDAERVWEWFAAERAAGSVTTNRTAEPLTADEIDDVLTLANPSPARVQVVASYLVWIVANGERPPEVVDRLAVLQQFLDRFDGLLSVRGSWLAAHALFALTDGDVLSLARARDRVLERLFEHGLRPDRDLPSFLRGTGLRAGDRFRAVRERVVDLHAAARSWSDRNHSTLGPATTRQYIDLIFAFGLARLGEADRCRELLEEVQVELHGTDSIHAWLLMAYGHRIEQGLAGKPTSTPLPESLLESLEAAFSVSADERKSMTTSQAQDLEKKLKLDRYKVDRLRQNSRILEPHEKIDAYRRFNRGFTDDLARELADLAEVSDRGELTSAVSELLSREMPRGDRVRLLSAVLQVGPRVGEVLSERMLVETLPLVEQVENVVERALLLERGLYVAAHFDRREELAEFVARMHTLLESQTRADLETLKSLHSLLSESFRGMRRLGMRDDIARLLDRLETLVAGIAVPRSKGKAKNVAEWNKITLEASRMKLQVASGWFYFGQDTRAWPIIEEVRKLVFGDDLMPVHRTTLLCAYLSALGQSPVDDAVPRMEEVFAKLDGVHDSYTTNTHYSVSQLNVVEATVLAMVGDDMILDPGARRWLDEDEYLVRRRIHADVRTAMAAEG